MIPMLAVPIQIFLAFTVIAQVTEWKINPGESIEVEFFPDTEICVVNDTPEQGIILIDNEATNINPNDKYCEAAPSGSVNYENVGSVSLIIDRHPL